MGIGSKGNSANPGHTVVLGVGNILLKDEGFGVHTIWELEKRRDELNLPSDVEIIDGGTLGLDLLHFIENKDKLIVVDIVDTGASAGTIFRFTPEDIETLSVRKLSFHQITLFDVLKMAESMGKSPKETVIIAVQPKEISWGMELTRELKKKIPEVIELVVKEVRKVKS